MSAKQENDIVTLVVYGTFGAMWVAAAVGGLMKWWLTG